MRRFVYGLLLAVLGPAPSAAQGFAGSIEARFLTETAPPQYFTWLVAGERWQMQLTDEGEQLAVIRILFDRESREHWEAGYLGGSRAIAGNPLPPDTLPRIPVPALTPGDGTQTIAGLPCSNYTFEADGHALSGCFAQGLGRFMAPRLRAPLSLPAVPGATPLFLGLPGWALMMSESELFPLKVWDAAGQVLLEVKRVTPGGLPECFYDLPATLPRPASPGSVMQSAQTSRAPDGSNQTTITLRDGRQVVAMSPAVPPLARGARPAPPPSCKPPATRPRRP